jgi:hypothetical protein
MSAMKSGNIKRLQELSKVIKAVWAKRDTQMMKEAIKIS